MSLGIWPEELDAETIVNGKMVYIGCQALDTYNEAITKLRYS